MRRFDLNKNETDTKHYKLVLERNVKNRGV